MSNQTPKQKNRALAALAYLWVGNFYLGWLPALIPEGKTDPFVRFHLKQSAAIVICTRVITAAVTPLYVLATALAEVHVIFNLLVAPLYIILISVGIFAMALHIIGLINACKSEYKEIAIVGWFATKYFK